MQCLADAASAAPGRHCFWGQGCLVLEQSSATPMPCASMTDLPCKTLMYHARHTTQEFANETGLVCRQQMPLQVDESISLRPVLPRNSYRSPNGVSTPFICSKSTAIPQSAARFESAWAAIQAAQHGPAAYHCNLSDSYNLPSPKQQLPATAYDHAGSASESISLSELSTEQVIHPGRLQNTQISLPGRIGRSSSDEASSVPEEGSAHGAGLSYHRDRHPSQPRQTRRTRPSAIPVSDRHEHCGQFQDLDGSHERCTRKPLATSASDSEASCKGALSLPPQTSAGSWQHQTGYTGIVSRTRQHGSWSMQGLMQTSRDKHRRARSEHRVARYLQEMSPHAANASTQPTLRSEPHVQRHQAGVDSHSEQRLQLNPVYSPEVSTPMLMPQHPAASGGSAAPKRPFQAGGGTRRNGAHHFRGRRPARVPKVVGKGPGMRENAVFGSPWSSFGSEQELEGMGPQALHMPRCSS